MEPRLLNRLSLRTYFAIKKTNQQRNECHQSTPQEEECTYSFQNGNKSGTAINTSTNQEQLPDQVPGKILSRCSSTFRLKRPIFAKNDQNNKPTISGPPVVPRLKEPFPKRNVNGTKNQTENDGEGKCTQTEFFQFQTASCHSFSVCCFQPQKSVLLVLHPYQHGEFSG